jgi:hypothetical protein
MERNCLTCDLALGATALILFAMAGFLWAVLS